MKSLSQIRSAYLEFFVKKKHEQTPSSSLVPVNDPSLLFTNAGMVQFKNYFTGAETAPSPRAVSAQKCLRAGGKHNDLDNVGYTARHHTFFEMLGNFSFGDYFKEEAIFYAWEFLTKEMGLSKEKLLVTIYTEDEEAGKLWKKITGLSEDKIIPISSSDNFWSMGETGPCGPCSEVFYDHGEKIAGKAPGSGDEEGDRFIEIWNLVFMQYEQLSQKKRITLPKPSIDTGMGLERMAALLQGKHDNYDTDLFRTLIKASVEISSVPAEGKHKASHRVIADHLRAMCFLIADGVMPSNEGRGYVLRRIMRRAMRHAHLLGVSEPILWKLVPILVSEMGAAYEELPRAEALIRQTVRDEEERFQEMLWRGLKLLEEELAKLGSKKTLPGKIAFRLYDTYGFPLDLTEDALREKNIKVDEKGFHDAMEKQRAKARMNWAGAGGEAMDEKWFALQKKIPPSEFVGYQASSAMGRVEALLVDGKIVQSAKAPCNIELIVNQTPFYGESGGQIGDSGVISKKGSQIIITDTKRKPGGLYVHIGKLKKGELVPGDEVSLEINEERRSAIRANHSATHLLHEALRRVLGEHVTQKGSLVEAERLRFDFSHPSAISAEQIAEVEAIVNDKIAQNGKVSTRLMTPQEAKKEGALALFGEKYGDEVRVLSMGQEKKGSREQYYSIELCGGTHVGRLGEIMMCKIIGQSAIGSGVRRIEALTGKGLYEHFVSEEKIIQENCALLKTSPAELSGRIAAIYKERKSLETELRSLKKKFAMGGGAKKEEEVENINGVPFLAKIISGMEARELPPLIDEGKEKFGSIIIALIAEREEKLSIAIGVSEDLLSRFNAVELVRIASEKLGGKGGGGRADMAQAGGTNAANAPKALDAIRQAIKKA
ncbi:MAG: alanine--tRNA ligase [Parvibaculales bacterium]